jgi:predicted metalloprotease with PDZ domain
MKRLLPRSSAAAWIVVAALVLNSHVLVARQHESHRAKAWLGVSIRDVTEKDAKENKLTGEAGAYVNEVSQKSPADSVGIEEGDVIVEFGKTHVTNADDLVKAVQKSKVGDKVDIILFRNGDKRDFHVLLTRNPQSRRLAFSIGNLGSRLSMMMNRESQGMHLMELNDQLGEYFGVPDGTGILVEKVNHGSSADKAGIIAGDVLLKIGKRTIDDLEDVSKAFAKLDEGDKVDVEVLRKGASKTLSLEVAEEHDAPLLDMFQHRGPDGEMFRMPHFEGDALEIPRWNNRGFRFEFRGMEPDLKVLREHIDGMSKRLNESPNGLEKKIQKLWMRTI